MSKLAYIKRSRYQYGDPALPLIGGLIAGAAKFLPKIIKGGGKLLGIGKKVLSTPTGKQVAQAVAAGGAFSAAGALMSPKGGRGASGGWGPRRAKGITATELRGFNRVASLLRKVGMVPRATRTKVRKGR